MESKEFKQIWYSLLIDGSYKFYRSDNIVEKYIKLLNNENFDAYYLNCNDWIDGNYFEKDYTMKFQRDNLKNFQLPDKEGNVIVLQNFEEYFSNHFEEAIIALSRINQLSWIYLLHGKKLIVFLNSIGNSINEHFHNMDNPLLKPIRWLDGDFPKY